MWVLIASVPDIYTLFALIPTSSVIFYDLCICEDSITSLFLKVNLRHNNFKNLFSFFFE